MGNCLRIRYLLIPLFLLSSTVVFAQENRSIASLYIDQAIMSIDRGETDRAYDLLLTAENFMPDNSDTHYLLAELDSARPAGFYAAIERCRNALSIDTWTRFSPMECRVLFAELLVRNGRADEAESILDSLSVTDLLSPRYYHVKAKILLDTGNTVESIKLLDGAVKKYPSEPGLKQLLLKISPSYRGRLITEYIENRYPYEHTDTVLIDLIKEPVDQDMKQKLINIYLSSGGTSPWVHMELIRIADDESAMPSYIDALYAGGGVTDGVLIDQLLPILQDTPYYEQLYDLSSQFTGEILVDETGDSYIETTYLYSGGAPVSVILDQDQDGLSEYDVVFEEGIPVSVSGVLDNRSVILNYSDYPYAERIVVTSDEKEVVYSLAPGEFAYPVFNFRFLDNQSPLNRPRLNPHRPVVTESTLTRKAAVISIAYSSRPDIVEVWEYLPGQKSWQKKEMDLKGRVSRKIYYKDGNPVHAGVDSDKDGLFEVTYQYEQGAIAGILFDENGDTIPEYSMAFGETDVRNWDFNGDSVIDCREKIMKEGEILREFSSAMDGVFDMEIFYDKNRIKWIHRDGEGRKTVTPGDDDSYSWVGNKPLFVLETIPSPGFHRVNGYSMSVFKQFGHTYIEVTE